MSSRFKEEEISKNKQLRLEYVKDFVEFDDDDIQALKSAGPVLGPVLPNLIDQVYFKLFSYDPTKQVFVQRYGSLDQATGEKILTLDSSAIKGRKDFLTRWVKMIIAGDYESGQIWKYMERVGVVHAGASLKHGPPLFVCLRDCLLLFGWLETILVKTLLDVPDSMLSIEEKARTIAAFNKVLWIQAEFFSHAQEKDQPPRSEILMSKPVGFALMVVALSTIVTAICWKLATGI
ncbi:hypothetical protein IE53DRAFT_384451 [Violaceomyces palustris]|uniref:Uncharacterized protein n=1 Tax=Violaceomyces palustris TaxID=1673888 RepID=A0ACD0P4S2_9BASI|nr:hypothetical protein IE53DRAFT_384451 [Violaceomyces palustris]